MKHIPLGSQGLTISRLGLGCMGMSAFYGSSDEQSNRDTLNRALDLGINFWDTSDVYGPKTNEELISRAIEGRREEVVIATKFGITVDDAGKIALNGRPEYVREACDASLKRLDIECIDLYYQHRVDPQVPIEETVGAMADLITAGKVRYLGLSEASAEQIQRAHSTAPITALQSEYSLWTRNVEAEVLAVTRELGIGLVAYSPLGRGFLTGNISSRDDLDSDDWRLNNPRFTEESFDANRSIAKKVQEYSSAKGVTPAQLALAWVLHQGDDVTAIPGTKRVRYLDENAEATAISFSDSELAELEEMFPVGVAAGARY
ncbi:MAG: aldo/keto reductase [Pseudomonadales bacterium]